MCLRGVRLRLRVRRRGALTMAPPVRGRSPIATLQRQNRWFAAQRNRLLRRAGLRTAQTILDIGSGPGVLLDSLSRRARGLLVGVDPDLTILRHARSPGVAGWAESLPFRDESVDLVLAQMVFLWMTDPGRALCEIRGTLSRRGTLLILAEPDYGAALEYPDSGALAELADSLRRQGADIHVARKLGGMIAEAGLVLTDCGMHAVKPIDAARADSRWAGPDLLPGRQDREFLFVPYFWFVARRPETLTSGPAASGTPSDRRRIPRD